MRGRVVLLVIVVLVVGSAVPASQAASTSRLNADCRDGIIQGSYSEKLVRRALASSPAELCEPALRFELAAVSMSEDVVRDCYEDGKLNGRYTRKEVLAAEHVIPSDIDEYSDCRSVIVKAGERLPFASTLARRARQARRPLTGAKALRYAHRFGDRRAGGRTFVKYAKRVAVRAVRVQAHYARDSRDSITRCYAEILVTRAGGTGTVSVRRLRKVCD